MLKALIYSQGASQLQNQSIPFLFNRFEMCTLSLLRTPRKAPSLLSSIELGRIPNVVRKGSAQYLQKLLLLRPLRCLLQSIVFMIVKTETEFANARALPSIGKKVVRTWHGDQK